MKFVYVAFINQEICAFHEKKSVMKDYLAVYKSSNPEDKCYMAKMSQLAAIQMREYDDLYLEDSGIGTYVQHKYVDTYLQMAVPDQTEMQQLIDGIYFTLEHIRCTKKQRKKLASSLGIIQEIKETNYKPYVPSIHLLADDYWRLEEYRRHVL